MASVTNLRTNTTKQVKNLGWLRRHATQVKTIQIERQGRYGAHLTVHLDGDRVYETAFQSFDLCKQWFHTKPSFQGATVIVHDQETTTTYTR